LSGLLPVVAGLGSGLVAASPVGPAELVDGVQGGADDERDERALDLVAGERYEGVGCGVTGVFVRALVSRVSNIVRNVPIQRRSTPDRPP
jgi:hypothetical protein